uniref:Uncharacterized protein n=1 Tax=Lotharella oceanica TaxID=641309 RepID=A0A7S2TH08_9EUKA
MEEEGGGVQSDFSTRTTPEAWFRLEKVFTRTNRITPPKEMAPVMLQTCGAWRRNLLEGWRRAIAAGLSFRYSRHRLTTGPAVATMELRHHHRRHQHFSSLRGRRHRYPLLDLLFLLALA